MSLKFKELDVVQLIVDLPDYGLKKGDIGAIVFINEENPVVYLVEFVDDEGREIAMPALKKNQVKLIWQVSTGKYVNDYDPKSK